MSVKEKENNIQSDSKSRIIESAIDAFAKNGFNGSSTAQIAEAAEVSEALLFKYYKSKKKLLEAVLYELVTVRIPAIVLKDLEHLEAMSGGGANGSGGPTGAAGVEEVIKRLIKTKVRLIHENISYFRILINEVQYHEDMKDIYVGQFVPKILDQMTQFFERLIEVGIGRPMPPRIAFRSLVGMMVMMILDKLVFRPELDFDNEVDEIVELFLHGFLKE